MLKNADYILENNLIADGTNTTLQYCKKATGVDLSAKTFYVLKTPGVLLNNKTVVGEYEEVQKQYFSLDVKGTNYSFKGWYLPKGSYICTLNEGIKLGPQDVGYVILRSSLNRNCVTLHSAVWDPSFDTITPTSIDSMSVRVTVETELGIYIEENSRVGQLLVFEIEDGAEQYNGQFQHKGLK